MPTGEEKTEYPQREKFYSHKFCRLLTKTCAAQELGPEVCWLLTVIAHQEDVKRYRGPVTYWNEQLMPLCGFGGRSRLVLARDKAVESGWLHYEAGTKGKPGTYWTTIPTHFADSPDVPMDESTDEFCRTEIGRQTDGIKKCRPESGHQVGRQADGKRTASGRQADGKPAPSLPVPIPSPNPSPIKEDAVVEIPEALRTYEFEQEWQIWVDRRKKKKWSTEPDCLSRQLAALEQVGPEIALQTLRETLKNGWQGIFPEKYANGSKPANPRVGPGQRYKAPAT